MRQPRPGRTVLRAAALIAVPAAIVAAAAENKATAVPEDALIAGFKQTYPASVSDAVELVTADPGRNLDGTARYGTISGSSARCWCIYCGKNCSPRKRCASASFRNRIQTHGARTSRCWKFSIAARSPAGRI